MALVFPPTDDPVQIAAIRLVRTIESRQPIYPGAVTYTWFNLLMDEAMKTGADKQITRCALRLIVQYLPITDRGLQWTLFVFHNCTVPSSWQQRVRASYLHLEPSTRNLYAFATSAPRPTVVQLADQARTLFNRFLTLPPPGVPLTLIDLAPVRAGYVQLRDFLVAG